MASLPNPSEGEWQEVRQKIKGKRLEETSPSTFARQARSSTTTTSKRFSTVPTSKRPSTLNTVNNSSTMDGSKGSSNGPLTSQRNRGNTTSFVNLKSNKNMLLEIIFSKAKYINYCLPLT